MENTTFVLYSPLLEGYLSEKGNNLNIRIFKTSSDALEQKEDMINHITNTEAEDLQYHLTIEECKDLEIHEINFKPINIIK